MGKLADAAVSILPSKRLDGARRPACVIQHDNYYLLAVREVAENLKKSRRRGLGAGKDGGEGKWGFSKAATATVKFPGKSSLCRQKGGSGKVIIKYV